VPELVQQSPTALEKKLFKFTKRCEAVGKTRLRDSKGRFLQGQEGVQMSKTFTVNVPVTFQEGFGVACIAKCANCNPCYDDEGVITDIEVQVVPITKALVCIVGGVPCVPLSSGGITVAYYPVENFRALTNLTADDTHDLRNRFFETEKEAQEHAQFVQRRWNNPAPWESFVATS
jgi:hypothetical protein